MKKFFISALVAVILILIACAGGGLTFKKMVTDKVIEKAVADLAEDIHIGRNGNYSNTEFHGFTWSCGFYARQAVYQKVIGKEYYNLLYASLAAAPDNFSSENYWVKTEGGNKQTYNKYLEILKVAREALRTPVGLKMVYLLHKEKALREIKRHGIAKEVEMELTEILPYFRGKVPSGDVGMSEKNAYQWICRRQAEGGKALVNIWVWVIQDMRDSL